MSNDMNTAWWLKLIAVNNTGKTTTVRGTTSKELINSTLVVDMKRPILSIKSRDLGYRFMFAEAWWILSGRNDLASIQPYSKIIGNFSDDGMWFQGAYGPKLIDQLSYIIDSFVKDVHTRQAVATIWNRNPRASKDHSCTVSIQWIIRDGKLHCIDTMRSSDIWLGVPYDVFNFAMYSTYIALVLRSKGIKVDLGDLYLNAGSQHLYDNNFENAAITMESRYETFDYEPVDLDKIRNAVSLVNYLNRAKDLKLNHQEWLYDSKDDMSKGKRSEGWYA